MKITTWNVNGIRAREAQVLDWLRAERPEVLCLQEIKASPADVPAALCSLEGYWCCWHGHKGYSGVALELRRDLAPGRPEFFHPPFDAEHRVVATRLGDLLVASIYVPNGGKDLAAKMRFLEGLERFVEVEHAQGTRLVLCGDLNVALEPRDVHPTQHKPTQVGQTPDERAALGRIIGRGLVDLLRRFHPDDDRLFTWWAPWRGFREKNYGWRIDYVLVSEALAAGATRCDSRRDFGTSDHGPVVAEVEVALSADLPAAPLSPPPDPPVAPDTAPERAPEPPAPPRPTQLALPLGGDAGGPRR